MKLIIKNMVCIRCKLVVQSELAKLEVRYKNLTLGEVELLDSLSKEQMEEFDKGLRMFGLELLVDKRAKIIEKIKTILIELIHYSDEELKINFPALLSKHLNYDYKYLSKIFSEVHGITIEHYIINQKIERVKELLVYNELSLSEIAWKLNYSSVQHLSNQFKKVTGLTPTFFKYMSAKRRAEINGF